MGLGLTNPRAPDGSPGTLTWLRGLVSCPPHLHTSPRMTEHAASDTIFEQEVLALAALRIRPR